MKAAKEQYKIDVGYNHSRFVVSDTVAMADTTARPTTQAARSYGSCTQYGSGNGTEGQLAVALPFKAIGVLNIVAAAPTLLINLSLLLAIMRTSTLRTKSNAILSCLLVVNLLQGCISLPFYGVIIIRQADSKADCLARDIVGYAGASLATVSMLSVDLLSLERYLAVIDPFKHEDRFTETRIKACVISIWVTSLVFMSFLKVSSLRVVAIIFATAVTAGTYIFNVIVHIRIQQVVRNLRRAQKSLEVNVADVSAQAAMEQQRKEWRTIKFSLYVIFFLLACYLPSVFKNVLLSLRINADVFMVIANSFLMMHATLSPLLYIWQSPPIGRAVKRLFRCRMNEPVLPMTN